MTKILICDDDSVFANKLSCKIRKVLDEMRRPAQIYIFQYAEEIPPKLLSECDIAILDVDFYKKKYTGIDIARQIRKIQKEAIIIFVTNYPEYAPEGYEVQAFRYLLKNEIGSKLKRYLLQSFVRLSETKRYFQIPQAGDVVTISLDSILYIEAQLHLVVVHMSETNAGNPTTYSYYSTLSSIEEELSHQGFLRIHKSYLVNMRHLQKYMSKEAVLSDGTSLKVSEKNYAEQKKKYLLWKGRQ